MDEQLGTVPRGRGRWTRAGVARWAVAGAGGLALVGVPGPAVAATADREPLVVVSGAPLVHVFDLEDPGDAAVGEWDVSTTAATPTPFDGVLTVDGPAAAHALAGALVVQYGTVGADGRVTAWHDAGTLAEPVGVSEALGRATTVTAGMPVRVPVRVLLPEAAPLDGTPARSLAVTATFTVGYLADDTPDPARPDHAAGRGDLAVTGGDVRLLVLLGTAAVIAGLALRRARDRVRDGGSGRARDGR